MEGELKQSFLILIKDFQHEFLDHSKNIVN